MTRASLDLLQGTLDVLFRKPERLVELFVQMPGLGIPPGPFSEPELTDLRRDSRTFETLGAVRMRYASLTGAGDPERLRAAFATADLFRVMGVSAALGRVFLADEDQRGRDAVAVLSHGLWER